MSTTLEHVARTDAGLASVLRVSVARLARRLRTESTSDQGLSVGTFTVLGVLHRNGECTIGELADHERVRPPSMTRTVSCLVEEGYVDRRPHESDRRQVLVTLTEKGEQTVIAERRRRDEWLAQHLRGFTHDERAVLRDAAPLLERLSNA